MYFAHVNKEQKQLLREHLAAVAELAERYAGDCNLPGWGRVVGLLHDLGKYRDAFQDYLLGHRASSSETHHAVYGAAWAFAHRDIAAAFSIAGHHTGLPNLNHLQALVTDPRYRACDQLPALLNLFESEMGRIPDVPNLPAFVGVDPVRVEFLIRMVFSCLVDADWTDTGAFMTGRKQESESLLDVGELLLNRVVQAREGKSRDGHLNVLRHAIFGDCLEAAKLPPGLFSLHVPTGGGKTLAGMAFALAHAQRCRMRRVIVVMPYLTIIEQNARVYRSILDPDNRGLVVEHHSASESQKTNEGERAPLSDLSVENWDAPVVVTTSVQFVESLLAARPSKCRKLHNIANSVVILDEVQTLPIRLLNPVLNVLRELASNYGTTLVMSSATQPAFREKVGTLSEGFRPGEVRELIADVPGLHRKLKRVQYRLVGRLIWADLATRLASECQVLCVLNVRRHAARVWEELRAVLPFEERDSVFHLSSAMNAAHRSSVLGEAENPAPGTVRYRLQNDLPCHLVTTQVVEAGVDIDFPCVYRALAPLDSIIQAAGRCNRENRLERGRVVVFEPEDPALPGNSYRTATGITSSLLNALGPNDADLDCPELATQYFDQLFQLANTDEENIQGDRRELRFRDVAEKARVIEDGVAVIAYHGAAKLLVDALRERPNKEGLPRLDRRDVRKLQPFMVNLRKRDFETLLNLRSIKPLVPNIDIYVLDEGCYHDALGLMIDRRPTEDLCGV